MTNRELLHAPKEALTPAQRQRPFVRRGQRTPAPCPACRKPVDALAASGLDVDRFAFGAATPPLRCPHGGAALEQVVPVLAAGHLWLWQRNHDGLCARLHKARLDEQGHPEGKL